MSNTMISGGSEDRAYLKGEIRRLVVVASAAWYAGALVVPVYETSAPEQVRWILADSGARGIVVETAEHYTRVDEVLPDLPGVDLVWQLHLGDLAKLAERGRGVDDAEIDRRRQLATETDIATAILEGRADAGMAVRAVAQRFRLDFVPLAWERFDLAMRRRDYFEPPAQKLLRFAQSPALGREAASLGGYDIAGLGTVVFNA